MKNNFKGNSLFNEVKDVRLQTWNRCAIVFNLMADRGQEAVTGYVSQFSAEDKQRITNMFALIKQYGYNTIRKQITPKVLEA
ncbi:hypothetical protein D3C85_346170 [compost metagenome]